MMTEVENMFVIGTLTAFPPFHKYGRDSGEITEVIKRVTDRARILFRSAACKLKCALPGHNLPFLHSPESSSSL